MRYLILLALLSLPVSAQAQREDALKQREATNVPAYLQEHNPIIAIALEQYDSTLSGIIHRRDNNMPMTDTEKAIAQWVNVCERSADAQSGQSIRAVLVALLTTLDHEASADSVTLECQGDGTVADAIADVEYRVVDIGATGETIEQVRECPPVSLPPAIPQKPKKKKQKK